MLELQSISKYFGNFAALKDTDFAVGAGEIVGLLGENGAGKSTLLRIIGGELAPDNGQIRWQNQPLHLASPREAGRLGIGVVHQHFMLAPALTVAENLALHAAGEEKLFTPQAWEERVQGWAARLGWRVDAHKRVEELGVGERQRVEILKALFARADTKGSGETANLLLLDEPTANLTPPETRELFATLRRLREEGRGLVFVSHKLNEVLALCDRVVVLRHGEVVGERAITETSAAELAALMVGRELESVQKTGAPTQQGEVCLRLEKISVGQLRDFSLSVQRGEIVGLAGVDGNGQSELAGVLCGLINPESGNIEINSALRTHHSALGLIPPDRQHVGLIPEFNLVENLALHPALREECRRPFGFDWQKARSRTRELMEKFDVRAPQAKEYSLASQLSGGNQQKLVIARALSFPHAAVLAADPARGLDVAAAQFVHEQLRAAATNGAGVLLISTDLDEIFALSHRIGVLYEGRLLPDENLLTSHVSRERIGALMGGNDLSGECGGRNAE